MKVGGYLTLGGRLGWVSERNEHSKTTVRYLILGGIEVARQPRCLDLLTPWGSLLGVRFTRNPPRSVGIARSKHADPQRRVCRWMPVNTRPLFLGLGGSNVVEVGVWRVGLVACWVTNDMRWRSRGRRVTAADLPDTEDAP